MIYFKCFWLLLMGVQIFPFSTLLLANVSSLSCLSVLWVITLAWTCPSSERVDVVYHRWFVAVRETHQSLRLSHEENILVIDDWHATKRTCSSFLGHFRQTVNIAHCEREISFLMFSCLFIVLKTTCVCVKPPTVCWKNTCHRPELKMVNLRAVCHLRPVLQRNSTFLCVTR